MLAIPASRFWPGRYRYRGSRSLRLATIPGLVAAIAGVDYLTGYEISLFVAYLVPITGHADVPMAVNAIKRGAFDFIEKPFQDQELLARIESVVRSDRSLLESRERRRLVASRLAVLSQREREVMDRVIEGKPDKFIAKELGISVKTVEAHRARMMGKLDVSSVAERVRLSVGWSKPGPTL